MSDCHWCKEADKEIAALKLQIDDLRRQNENDLGLQVAATSKERKLAEQAKVDRDCCCAGTEVLRVKLEESNRLVGSMKNVVDAARAWRNWEQWPYLQNGGFLAHALDALDKLEHHENCDVLDTQIKGKPCNCKQTEKRKYADPLQTCGALCHLPFGAECTRKCCGACRTYPE